VELAQVVAAWPLGASLAAALALQGIHAGRRRSVLNEAVHELRRPLQALALAAPAAPQGQASPIEGAVQMAARALERLEREVNGGPAPLLRAPLPVRPLLALAVARWQDRAAMAGASLSSVWRAGAVEIEADRAEIGQALDNLIVNAIEHGGTEILVEASLSAGGLCIAVADSGRGVRVGRLRKSPAESIALLLGRRRHGHGLRVVRRIARDHGGSFQLRTARRGTEAVLELPAAVRGGGA
jgi:signal transduction histidine kinase